MYFHQPTGQNHKTYSKVKNSEWQYAEINACQIHRICFKVDLNWSIII